MSLAVVILAAGQSTRMKSDLPKPLHPIAGRSMISYCVEAASKLGAGKPVVVVGHGMEQVKVALGDSAQYVIQEQRLGTAHAVLQAQSLLQGQADTVLVYYVDMPLLTEDTQQRLLKEHKASGAPATILVLKASNPRGFGRVVRKPDGSVQAVVEEVDCSTDQLTIRELNAGVYCFDARWLWENLPTIPKSAKGEYYLTDTVGLAVSQGHSVSAVTTEDEDECLGINTRVHLAEAERVMSRRINRQHMLNGVSMIDPDSVHIDSTVEIGQDSLIQPNTWLKGSSKIGRDCIIGPGSILEDTVVGNGCEIKLSVCEQATLEDDVDIGPFAHLRKGAHLASGVHMGNFGEVKNSYLGPGVKMGHFSYLGDTTVGADANIGAGTITCNYDGTRKHQTIIGEGAFIGSDTMLVAPVNIGKGAKTGAGSVVTRDVAPGSVVYGVPARDVSAGSVKNPDTPLDEAEAGDSA